DMTAPAQGRSLPGGRPMTRAIACYPIPNDSPLKARFLALVPRIKTHAQIHFRDVRCPDTRAEKIAECLALAWKWFVRLAERGKDAEQFPVAFTILVAKSVRCGRRLCGAEKAKDALSPVA